MADGGSGAKVKRVLTPEEQHRKDFDQFFTPEPLAAFLLTRLAEDGFWKGGDVLEPSAGRGSFVRAAHGLTTFPRSVTAVEMDPLLVPGLAEATNDPLSVRVGDFEELAFQHNERFALIAGNPPFSHAQAHIEKALGMRTSFGVCAFLLRMAFLESKDRVPFWKQNPASKIYALAQRPDFTGGGGDKASYGFFVWASWWRGPTEIEVVSWREPKKRERKTKRATGSAKEE